MASYRIRAAFHHDRVSVLSKFNEVERSRVGWLRNKKANPVNGDLPGSVHSAENRQQHLPQPS
jgi:hypothetical protein